MAAASERRGTPGATAHYQMARHVTTRDPPHNRPQSAPEIADPLHQRALTRAQSGWQFAAPVLHLDDTRHFLAVASKRRSHYPDSGEHAC
jgi:hypothetical protein